MGILERNQHNIKIYGRQAIDIAEGFRCKNQSAVSIREALKLLLGENIWAWSVLNRYSTALPPVLPLTLTPPARYHITLSSVAKQSCCHSLMRIKMEFNNPSICLVVRKTIC